jgi:ubiquitin-conjugating enzyme E2 D/E
MKKLQRELRDLEDNPQKDFTIGPKADDLFHWEGIIFGPPATAYAGGCFFVELQFPSDYPFKPPIISFKTQIYHVNITIDGKICSDITKDWSPTLGVRKIMNDLILLLQSQNVDDPLNSEAAHLFKTDRELFDSKVAEWTSKYAT